MSTPPGKPHSTHVSHKAHEGAVTEPPRSPYAPKQAHQRAGTEHYPVENDRDPLRSPYAPKQARTTRYSGDDTRRASRACASIPRGTLMKRLIRILGDTSSQPLNIVTKG